jgi:hypothetical protein
VMDCVASLSWELDPPPSTTAPSEQLGGDDARDARNDQTCFAADYWPPSRRVQSNRIDAMLDAELWLCSGLHRSSREE